MLENQDQLPETALVVAARACLKRHGMSASGLHGLSHWWRVRHNAQLLAPAMGASMRVTRLFAIFHDAHRQDDGHDPEHGPRAAAWLAQVRKGDPTVEDACAATRAVICGLSEREFESLHEACRLHTGTRHHGDASVATCFVADRLDLSRVGSRPDPAWLPLPRSVVSDQVIEAAMQRSRLGLAWPGGEEIGRVWGVAEGP